MKSTRPIRLLLLLAAAIACCGCSSLTGASDDRLTEDDRSSAMFDLEKLPGKVTESTKQLVGLGTDPDKARKLYAQASEVFHRAGQAAPDERDDLYLEAAGFYESAAARWPDSALQQDALFMAGESYFFADRYPKANTQYELLLKNFPNSRYIDTVESRRFSIAHYWLQLADNKPDSFWKYNFTNKRRPARNTFGEAVRVFDKIRIDDPTGKLADDATLAAGNAYFAAGKYIDADNFYTDLRKTFPSSEHQFQAHLLGIKTKLLSYQGPQYSGDPLDDAEKLIKQVVKQFPRQAAEHREQLNRAYAEVRARQAEREWQMASYYDRRSENGSARFYYSILTNQFADTSYADQARERLVALGGEPDLPPQRMQWLVNLFPETEDVKPLMAGSSTGSVRR